MTAPFLSRRLSRRRLLGTGIAAAALALARRPLAFGLAEPQAGEEVVPFLDPQPIDPKRPMLKWEDLTDWLTPADRFFDVSHYGNAKVAEADWKLSVEGLVDKPLSLSLEQIKARPRREAPCTLECSGNGAAASFMGAIGNARWAGTPLAPLLKECGLKAGALNVVFWGADKGKEKVHNNIEFEAHFARSLSVADATRDEVLLAYEMSGQPLSPGHGFPLRLVVPGWYGIAWVKWLSRVEVTDKPILNRFMARDYVTLRGEERDGQTLWRETSVGPMNVKSLVARVTRRPDEREAPLRVTGAAWTDGTPLKTVEVKIDGGDWLPARLDEAHADPFCWRFWSFDWRGAAPGEHTLVSRATDEKGRVQPAVDDPAIRLKKTYWEANAQYPRRVKL